MGLLKKILNRTYRPLVKKYLLSDRAYSYQGIGIMVRSGVFHPGFFFSTRFLLDEINTLPLKGKTLLELGCGSGLISILAAKKGALVTASDINPMAVSCARENALKNDVQITTIVSDLMKAIPVQAFDYIIINPPYYRGAADDAAAMAWYCGEHLEYFDRLFGQIGAFTGSQTSVLMVLSEDCEMDAIKNIALKHDKEMLLHRSRRLWMERNFIFEVKAKD